MILRSQAIVLSCIKYGDQSLIVKAYTNQKGLLTLITSRRKKKQNQATLFQPFNRLLIDFSFTPNKSIHRLKETSLKTSYEGQYSVPISAVKMFLSEFTLKLLPEEDSQEELFNFLWEKATLVENKTTDLSTFNLRFLHEISEILGVQPNFSTKGEYFDFRESQFVENKPTHQNFETGNKNLINRFLSGVSLKKAERSSLLNFYLLSFEAQFGSNISRLKSLGVLQAVFA